MSCHVLQDDAICCKVVLEVWTCLIPFAFCIVCMLFLDCFSTFIIDSLIVHDATRFIFDMIGVKYVKSHFCSVLF